MFLLGDEMFSSGIIKHILVKWPKKDVDAMGLGKGRKARRNQIEAIERKTKEQIERKDCIQERKTE